MKKITCNESTAIRVGMITAMRILEKWNCNQQQFQTLLMLPENYNDIDLEKMCFSQDQVERVSYILNIHAGLSTLFSNPENIYGFMNMVNYNEPFNGTKPIDILCDEKTNQFEIIFNHIYQLLER